MRQNVFNSLFSCSNPSLYYRRLKSLCRLPQLVFIFLHWQCPDFITDYFKAGEILG